MVSVLADDLASSAVDSDIVFTGGSTPNPKPDSPFVWGEPSYGNDAVPPDCLNSQGKFSGCAVVNHNDETSMSFSFGMSDPDSGCEFAAPLIYKNDSHCDIEIAITNPAGQTNMPAWSPPNGQCASVCVARIYMMLCIYPRGIWHMAT